MVFIKNILFLVFLLTIGCEKEIPRKQFQFYTKCQVYYTSIEAQRDFRTAIVLKGGELCPYNRFDVSEKYYYECITNDGQVGRTYEIKITCAAE